jgi:hypothetical protein
MEPPFAEGRPTVHSAVEWASQMHGHQRRTMDHAPFVLHPLEVASLLYGRGFDDEVIAAGVLHDLVENTDATIAEVRERFGDQSRGSSPRRPRTRRSRPTARRRRPCAISRGRRTRGPRALCRR